MSFWHFARVGGCAGRNYTFLTSKERDNETGLDYFLARYYSSTQGRFTGVDPEQEGARNDDPQSWNGYAASKLAHEVGHHVIATRGYIHKPWEKYKPWNGTVDPYAKKMADAYASDVINKMLRSWRYKFAKLLARMLSTFLYKAGIQEYWDGNYQSSASLQSRAYTLNLENEEAGQCYRHAMEKLKTQTPSPLSAEEREWLINKYNPTPMTSGKLLLTKKNTGKNKHRPSAQSSIDTEQIGTASSE